MQQRDVLDDDGIGIEPSDVLRDPLVLFNHLRMHNLIQSGPLLLVGEDHVCQLPAVQGLILIEEFIAETLDYLPPRLRVLVNRLSGQFVPIDCIGAEFPEEAGYCALAGANTSCKPDHNHQCASFTSMMASWRITFDSKGNATDTGLPEDCVP